MQPYDHAKMTIAVAFGLLIAAICAFPAKAEGPTFYAGVHLGVVSTNSELAAAPFGIDGLGANGKIAGVHGGVDFAIPDTALFAGPIARYTFSDAEFSVSPGIFSAKIKNSYSLGARAGVKVGDAKPYILIAYTSADLDWTSIAPLPAAPDLKGLSLGIGLDLPIKASGLVFGIEGVWTQFKEQTIVSPLTMQTDSLEVMLRMSFALGMPK